jgi:hypothetical protein
MMTRMTLVQRTVSRCLTLAAAVAPIAISAMSWAAAKTEDSPELEARFEGYKDAVRLETPGSTAPYWLLLVGLGLVCLIVLFKDAKRSHLD